MKKYWKSLSLVGSIAALSASAAFGQTGYYGYNGGACAPNCELPPVCEPVAPACEPVCDVPPAACEPTCDVAPCEPSCGPAYGCDPYCGPGYCGFNGCAPCYDVAAFVGGALGGAFEIASAPFHWAAAMLTEGIYPDCGCAPRPPKTNCDPCDMCGNFVGGCGEECETAVCANGYNGYAGYNNAYGNGYDASAYPVGAYDSEAYDASPTRQKAPAGVPSTSRVAPETLPREAVQRGGLSQAPQYRRPSFAFGSLDVQTLVGNKRRTPNAAPVAPLPATRSGRYEEEYVVQTFEPSASQIRQVSGLTRSTQTPQISQNYVVPHSTEMKQARPSQATQVRQSARYPQETQVVVPNVRSAQSVVRPLADATPVVEERATARPRTFGQVRPAR